MFTVHCYVCGKDIGFMGWANHVRMEKKKHGKDIYKLKRLGRNNRTEADIILMLDESEKLRFEMLKELYGMVYVEIKNGKATIIEPKYMELKNRSILEFEDVEK